MEDRSQVINMFVPNTDVRFAFYCVFDGHGGDAAVAVAQQVLTGHLVQSEEWAQGCQERTRHKRKSVQEQDKKKKRVEEEDKRKSNVQEQDKKKKRVEEEDKRTRQKKKA
jgi:serine/threonine protein phosphatase PrpC